MSTLTQPKSLAVVVDRDEAYRQHVKMFIEEMGHPVLVLTDPYDTIYFVNKTLDEPAIVLVDYNISLDYPGPKLIAHITERRKSPIAAILVCQKHDVDQVVQGYDSGAIGCIAKTPIEGDPRLSHNLGRDFAALIRRADRLLKNEMAPPFDPLTRSAKVYTLQGGMERWKQTWMDARQDKTYTSCIFMDVNGLGELNTRHGHLVGNKLIVGFAKTLYQHIRPYDYVVRFGGDEFVIFLPKATERSARHVLQRLRAEMGKTSLEVVPDKFVTLSFSSGIAEIGPKQLDEGPEATYDYLIAWANQLERNMKAKIKAQKAARAA